MSDSNPRNDTAADQPDVGLIPDEALPDDLRPDKNPMARPAEEGQSPAGQSDEPATGGPSS
jgi:hypothetical protein